jgi:hypothetical protein
MLNIPHQPLNGLNEKDQKEYAIACCNALTQYIRTVNPWLKDEHPATFDCLQRIKVFQNPEFKYFGSVEPQRQAGRYLVEHWDTQGRRLI